MTHSQPSQNTFGLLSVWFGVIPVGHIVSHVSGHTLSTSLTKNLRQSKYSTAQLRWRPS